MADIILFQGRGGRRLPIQKTQDFQAAWSGSTKESKGNASYGGAGEAFTEQGYSDKNGQGRPYRANYGRDKELPWIFAFGLRVFQYVIPIVPNVAGQVVEVPVEGTAPVKKDDVLFRIDPTPYQFKVDQLAASIKQAEAQKTLAEIEVERAAGLVKVSAGAQSQLDQWNAQLAAADK